MQPSAPNNTLRPALYYESLPDGRVRCTLCPYDCTIAPGHRGACGVRVNRRGRLFTLVGDRIVVAELDPIEKKPLFHFLPGSQAYSISTVGCNLHCHFCQNWRKQRGLEKAKGSDPFMSTPIIPLRGRYGMNTVTRQAESSMQTEW